MPAQPLHPTLITSEHLDEIAELLQTPQNHKAIAKRFKLTTIELGELVQTPAFERRRNSLKALQAIHQEAINQRDDELSRAKLREEIAHDDPKVSLRAAIALQRAIRPPATRSPRAATTLRNQAGAAPSLPSISKPLPPNELRPILPLDPPRQDTNPDYLIEATLHQLRADPAKDNEDLYKRLYTFLAFPIKTGQLRKKFEESLEATDLLKCSTLEPGIPDKPSQICSAPPADETLLPSLGTVENPTNFNHPKTKVILSATKTIKFTQYDTKNLTRKLFPLTFHLIYEQPFDHQHAHWSIENITIPPPVPRPNNI